MEPVAFACIVVMGVVGISLKKLVSDGATEVALCAGAATASFCLAGCATTLFRQYLLLPDARRLGPRGDRDTYEAALRRSLPPNSSVFFQAAVGILAAAWSR